MDNDATPTLSHRRRDGERRRRDGDVHGDVERGERAAGERGLRDGQRDGDGGADYTAGSGTLSFAAGVTTKTIVVPILEDTLDELNETFTVNLSQPDATRRSRMGQGIGTITDNDATPTLSIDDVTVNEGAGTATFTVTLERGERAAGERGLLRRPTGRRRAGRITRRRAGR